MTNIVLTEKETKVGKDTKIADRIAVEKSTITIDRTDIGKGVAMTMKMRRGTARHIIHIVEVVEVVIDVIDEN